MCLCSCPHPEMPSKHVLRTLCFSSESAVAEWVCKAICSIRAGLKQNTFNKEPTVCDLFLFQTLELAYSDFYFFFFFPPSVAGILVL